MTPMLAAALVQVLTSIGYTAEAVPNPTPPAGAAADDSVVHVTPKTVRTLATATDAIGFVLSEGIN